MRNSLIILLAFANEGIKAQRIDDDLLNFEDKKDLFDATRFELGLKPALPKLKQPFIVKSSQPLFEAKAVKENMKKLFKLDIDPFSTLSQPSTISFDHSMQ